MTFLRLETLFIVFYLTLQQSLASTTFYFTSTPTQCSNMTVQWLGGQAPFTLLLVPTGHLNPETRTIIQKNIPSGNSVSFVLDFPAGSQFVAVLSDAIGIGAGGTSAVTTVASSSDSSCLNSTPSQPKFFLFLPEDIGQCDSVDISWSPQAQDPVDILGIIPGGESFEIANVTDSSSSLSWTADVHSGTQLMLVAGDKDGLGSGGSSDVMQVQDGNNDQCINDQSPSSTSGIPAGGVSSTAQTAGQSDPGSAGGGAGSTGVVTTDNAGSTVTVGGSVTTDDSGSTYTAIGSTGVVTTTDNAGSSVTVNGPIGPITTTDNAGSTVTIGPTTPIVTTDSSGSTVTIANGGPTGTGGSSSNSDIPGSGGGTVTGSSPGSGDRHNNLGLILGIIFGLLALGLLIGILLLRHRKRENAYRNIERGASNAARPNPWLTALTRGAHHIRGGAASSVDTLPSMYQTEPFILPSEHQPYYMDPQAPLPIQQRPILAARASSSRSVHSLLGDSPLVRDAFGGALVGIHGSDQKDNIGPHGQPPSRTASGRGVVTRSGMPPPTTSDPPTRVTRDSEDFTDEPEEMSPNPFEDPVVEIPPTYASVRRASRSNDRESWQPSRARLVRSNASRHSQRSMRSETGDLSQESATR